MSLARLGRRALIVLTVLFVIAFFAGSAVEQSQQDTDISLVGEFCDQSRLENELADVQFDVPEVLKRMSMNDISVQGQCAVVAAALLDRDVQHEEEEIRELLVESSDHGDPELFWTLARFDWDASCAMLDSKTEFAIGENATSEQWGNCS